MMSGESCGGSSHCHHERSFVHQIGINKTRPNSKRHCEKKEDCIYSDKGVDIRTSTQVIEDEIDTAKFKEDGRQLQVNK